MFRRAAKSQALFGGEDRRVWKFFRFHFYHFRFLFLLFLRILFRRLNDCFFVIRTPKLELNELDVLEIAAIKPIDLKQLLLAFWHILHVLTQVIFSIPRASIKIYQKVIEFINGIEIMPFWVNEFLVRRIFVTV